MKFGILNGIAAALLLSGATAGPVSAGEVKLPSTLAWSAYNTGTTGYNQSVAIGKALKDKYGVSLGSFLERTIFPGSHRCVKARCNSLPTAVRPILRLKVYLCFQPANGVR